MIERVLTVAELSALVDLLAAVPGQLTAGEHVRLALIHLDRAGLSQAGQARVADIARAENATLVVPSE